MEHVYLITDAPERPQQPEPARAEVVPVAPPSPPVVPDAPRKDSSALVIGGIAAFAALGSGLILTGLTMAVIDLLGWIGVQAEHYGAAFLLSFLAVFLIGGGSACVGIHCSGCRR